MKNILFTSENRFFLKADGELTEYPSQMIARFCDNQKSAQRRNEWKTSGAGARFGGTYVQQADDDAWAGMTGINGVSSYGGKLIYSVRLGEFCGLYKKPLEKGADEGHVTAGNEMHIYKLSAHKDSCAAGVGGKTERHIAIFDLNTGHYRELTEGDVLEDYPCYSRDGSNIFYSSAGLAMSPQGQPVGLGPFGLMCYHVEENSMVEVLASDQFNYIAPKEDRDGSLLFIKRPYKNAGDKGNILQDIVYFPGRIARAIGGLLNYFSIRYGGESLRSGGAGRDTKSKQKSEKELFFEGNAINAEQILKENERHGEKFPGIIPRSWELVRLDKNGGQTCLKKGVMDYTVCEDGDIVYSNGNAIIRLSPDGGEQLVQKCRMAVNLVEL